MRRGDDIDLELDGRGDFDGRGDVRELGTKELLSSLVENGKVLLKEEVRLAKAEIQHEAKRAGRAAGSIGAGGLLLHTGWLMFAAFLVMALDVVLPLWAAGLIVALVLLAVGAFLA